VKETTETTTAFTRGGGDFLHNLWASVAAAVILIVICCGIYPLAVWAIAQGVFPHQANGSLVKKDGTPAKLAQGEPGTTQPDAVGSTLIGQNFSPPEYFHPRPSSAGNGYDPKASGGSNYGPLSDELINGLTATPTPDASTTQPTTAPAVVAPTTVPAVVVATTQPGETLTFDGVRLRTLHYAVDNGFSFKLVRVKLGDIAADGAIHGPTTEVPLAMYQDSSGLLDMALVDAFPHPQKDAPDRMVLVAQDFKTSDGKPVLIPADAVTASASGLDPHISPANAALQAQRVADARKIPVKQVQDLIGQFTDGRDLGFLGDPGVNVLRLNLALDAKYPVPAAPAAPTTGPAK
jgi:K+-transporting ATPase ATPase C chain